MSEDPTASFTAPSLIQTYPSLLVMISETHPGCVELPPELWQRILRGAETDWKQIKALSLVSRLFAGICQVLLFQELSASPNVGVSFTNYRFGQPGAPWRPPGAKPWPVQEWEWEEWENNMRKCILSERRLTLIGSHRLLCSQPRKLTIHGYGGRHVRGGYPADPFQPPSKRQMLSKAIFDALSQFRQTLLKQLPALSSLRRLELYKYPVDDKLLAAFDLHPSLTELRFNFCWFPESPAPLTSITSLSFGTIPGHHFHLVYYIPGHDPYKNVPDHHLASAFALISPPHIKELEIDFGTDGSAIEPVFAQLCTRTFVKGDFLRLHSLSWRFRTSGGESVSIPTALVFQFLGRTPALRKLNVGGNPPSLPLVNHLPPRSMPLLETLSCPLEWARVLVPGRPVNDIRVYLQGEAKTATFLTQGETELEDFLHPLTLSTVPVTTLHLPTYPPVGPASLFFPYLTARFPALRDLRVAVAEDKVASLPIQWRCGTRSGPPMPSNDTSEQIVEEELLDMLQRDIRVDVERTLGGMNSGLPPVLDRIMAFRGIEEEPTTKGDEGGPLPNRPIIVQPGSWYTPRSPSPSNPHDLHEAAKGDPLARFNKYFGEPDGTPCSKPQTDLDIVYFLARGYYPLPRCLKALALFSCFEKTPLGRYSRSEAPVEKYPYDKDKEDYELCMQSTLAEIVALLPELFDMRFSDSINQGQDTSYRRGHSERGAWLRSCGYFEFDVL